MEPTCSVDDCDSPTLARNWCRRHYTRWYETGSLELGVRQRGNNRPVRTLADRFWEKVRKTDACWIWVGAKTTLGYGMIWSGPGGRHLMAHRVSWEFENGRTLTEDEKIDHLCMVPSCVNPEHLEPVTVAENTRRGYAGPIAAAMQLAKTHCPQGHPYDSANTHITKLGKRMCLTCIRVRQRAQRAARKKGIPYVDPYKQ